MDQASPQPNILADNNTFPFNGPFWALLILTGILTGIAAGLLMKLLRAVQHLAWNYHTGTFLQGVQATTYSHRVVILVCAGILTGPALWLIDRTGQSEGGLSASIWFKSGKLPTLRTFASGVLAIVLVGLGVSLGREGAPKEAGAAIASRLCQWARLTRAQRRVLAACAAGAGMAAVYNVPLGGALFGLEVLLGRLDLPLVLPAIAISLIATATSWLFLPPEMTYSTPAYALSAGQTIWALLAGPSIGLASIVYIRLISWAGLQKAKGKARMVLPVVVLALLGVTAIAFPQILGNGKNVVQLALDGKVGSPMAGTLLILKVLATAACLRAGAPGGLFTPTLTCGALIGALLSPLAGISPGVPVGTYALLGGGALLAAATQGPVSAVVLVWELTGHLTSIMVPLLLAITGASIVTRMFESRSIYSGRIPVHLSMEIPEEHLQSNALSRQTAISAAAPYDSVLERLLGNCGNNLHVIDQKGKLVGTIRPETIHASLNEFGSPRQIATAYDLARPGENGNSEMRTAAGYCAATGKV